MLRAQIIIIDGEEMISCERQRAGKRRSGAGAKDVPSSKPGIVAAEYV